ncbi:Hsp70 family protein [Dactylosporangium sp. NPDC005555]|uniref:Hsp70 family protein n=1 Tax=Dactylosporangium sp. NPDC005555 TaxID=3154889 RepID=UPI0033BDBC31
MAGRHSHAVGIDFGTSTSLVAERRGRLPATIVPLGVGTQWFPSIAGYDDGELLVGEDADELPSDRVIRSVKRAITRFEDTVVVAGDTGRQQVAADDVMTAVLVEIVRRAEAAGRPITEGHDLRLGCPAMWDGQQRSRMLSLATKAGLPVDSSTLIDEPIAAGVAWVTHRYLRYSERPKGRLLVFDMGGGTLDIAVLDVIGGDTPEISVLSALGVDQAGDTLDRAIADDLIALYADSGIDVWDRAAEEYVDAELLRAARSAKEHLSQVPEYRVLLPRRTMGDLPSLTYRKEQLEEAFRPQLNRALTLVWAAIRAARLTERGGRSPEQLRAVDPIDLAQDIDYVLLAGGMSRIPYVEQQIGQAFPRAQVFDNAGVAADEAIVAGLADTGSYDRLNLHRPGFDFVVEWEEHGRLRQEVLYEAYTPLYTPQQVLNGMFDLGYARHGRQFPGPSQGTGVLRIRSTSGEYLSLMYIDGGANGRQEMDGFALKFGSSSMAFKLYCDGRVHIRDATGWDRQMRVERWPVIRGRDHAQLVLRGVEGATAAAPTAWYLNKDWAPPLSR